MKFCHQCPWMSLAGLIHNMSWELVREDGEKKVRRDPAKGRSGSESQNGE